MSLLKNRIIFSSILFIVTFTVVYLLRGSRDTHYILPVKPQENAIHLATNTPIKKSEIPILNALNKEYSAIMDAVVPSVVSIDTIRTTRVPQTSNDDQVRFTQFTQNAALGAGVIVSQEGHILTNNHVIEGKESIQVALWNGEKYMAKRVGHDKLMDLAVLKINTNRVLTPLPFGNSDKIHVGEIVFAIGNPYGLGETVTRGIISAKQRFLGDSQSPLIQTDASVNRGNSGGPLVNVYGEIIGLTSYVYGSKDNSRTEGLNFAIPSNLAKKVFEQICQWGKPKRGYIGLQLLDINDQIKTTLQFDEDHGVAINEMHPDSPAMKLGISPGDIILTYNGEKMANARELLSLIHDSPIGQDAHLKIWSKGKIKEVAIPILESGVPLPDNERPICPKIEQLKLLGIHVRDLTLEEYAGGLKGVLINNISSPKTAQILRAGDLIQQINSKPINSKGDLCDALSEADVYTFHIVRGRYVFDIRIFFEESEFSNKECPIKGQSHYPVQEQAPTLEEEPEPTPTT